jgi:signal transduction histidine kinase
MQMLVNDLLRFSRQKEEILSFEKTDLNTVLKEVLNDMEVEIESKKASITTSVLPAIDAIPSLVRQLFQNLISNSLKFCKDDCQPVIQIRTEKISQPNINGSFNVLKNTHYHQIYFSDNGIGFEQQYLEEIFIVFKRLHSQQSYQGSGIGLSICKKIVEKHNGHITAHSKVNEGSTFVITLPENLS